MPVDTSQAYRTRLGSFLQIRQLPRCCFSTCMKRRLPRTWPSDVLQADQPRAAVLIENKIMSGIAKAGFDQIDTRSLRVALLRDEAISTDRALSGPRLLRSAHNDAWNEQFNPIGTRYRS